MTWWFVFFGCVLFVVGSTAVMRGGGAVARVFGVSQLTIGLLVIPAASATPELFVALRGAALAPDLAVGGIVGSAVMTLTLILGLGALIQPLAVPPKVVFRDGAALLAAGGIFAMFARNGIIGHIEGALLILAFVLYVALAAYTDWRRASCHSVARIRAEALEHSRLGISGGLFVTILGVVAVMLGAHFMLVGGQALARDYQLPEYAVGLTVMALAVSLPEFFVVMGGALRGHNTVAVGNVFVSNIFNLTLIVGMAALLTPLRIAPVLADPNGWLMFGVCALVPLLAAMRWLLSRPRGVILILAYAVFTAMLAAEIGLWSIPVFRLW